MAPQLTVAEPLVAHRPMCSTACAPTAQRRPPWVYRFTHPARHNDDRPGSHNGERRAMIQDDKATFGYYLVGVFDVLGQSKKLREPTRSPSIEDPAEQQRILANLKDTAGVVLGFRKLFANFFDGVDNAPPSPLLRFLPPHSQEMLAATASEIVRWGVRTPFSSLPAGSGTAPAAPVADMFRSLLAAAAMWMAGLSTNHPIRGGMEIGTGIDIAPGEIYGQALDAAYHLSPE